ncbi:MAG: hypothetical protein O7C67_18380 [Gammaproteobacteria bacterium]|nr:hypothetical protein [Gammaproteobacteria bacterium]
MQATQCFDGQTFVLAANPTDRFGTATVVPQDLELVEAARFNRGEAIYLRLEDPDQDLNPFAADTLELNLSVVGQLDTERILLTETGASTGIFTGYAQTNAASPQVNDCALSADPSSVVLVAYADPDDASDTNDVSVVLDPGFTLFESAAGAHIDGVDVTLIDVATGLPAQVFSLDGVTSFPATVPSGGAATDANGMDFDFAPGAFYFPVIPPGTYRLDVLAPATFTFPSVVADADLNNLPTGPYTLVPGSRGADFDVVLGSVPGFDLPLDVAQQSVFVTKQVSKPSASIGDFVQYQVLVRTNDSSGLVTTMDVTDTLPKGFRYREGSARLDGAPAPDPYVSVDGRTLTFAVVPSTIADRVELRYVTEITAGAELGRARNSVTASGPAVAGANVAYADVTVREDLFQSKSFIAGQVYDGACGSKASAGRSVGGLRDVRLWLEDGTYVVTDQQGKFHFEGVEPGSHVVQLDVASLPAGYEVLTCDANTRFAGSSYSQFVDLQPGALWRADFTVAPLPDRQGAITTQLHAELQDWQLRYRYVIEGDALSVDTLSATLMLSDQVGYVPASATLNGRAIDEPTGIEMGAVTFRLPAPEGVFRYELEFRVDAHDATTLIVTKAITMLSNAAGRHRSGVVTNELSVFWPSSMEDVTQTSDSEVQAFEPTRNNLRVASEVDRLVLTEVTEVVATAPYELPEVDNAEAPAFDHNWLAQQNEQIELVWPPERYNPRVPSVLIAVKHPKGTRPLVLVDDRIVNPITFEGTVSDHERGLSVTIWDNVPISELDSVIEAQVLGSDGQLIASKRRTVHFGQAPVRAELVRDASYLVADGIHPPMLAVRLYDRSGYPARPGISGEFAIDAPYRPLDKTKHLEATEAGLASMNYQVLRDGIAYIQLEPTTDTGEVTLRFSFDQHRSEIVRARLKPGVRGWILVGLAEGVLGHNDVTGNLQSADVEDDVVTDGRIAFYAKGMIKGEWLLTAAYDTDKDTERQLRQQIDPNRFYTLYGDGTNQRYDAESQRKLYLKLERADFETLVGDFDTAFDRTEVTKYTRTLNGIKAGYYGERVKVEAFASDTNQGLEFDEIRGDGTSGVYRLSKRDVVINSERVSLVTRDRLQLDRVIERLQLARYLDYSIDFDAGTLIFKQPVFSQDASFNPIFIEVEYEVERDGFSDELVAGTRIAYRLDDVDSEAALTYINDDAEGSRGELMGVDLNWQVTPERQVRVEVARTDTEAQGSAHAYLVEVEHRSEKLAGRLFVREQELAFGLGQQTTLEADTRRYGAEGEYRVNEELLIRGQVIRQESLKQAGDRTVVLTEARQRIGSSFVKAGVQAIDEKTASGEQRRTQQVTLGASRDFMNGKLTLRGDAEIDFGQGETTDYPTRSVLGAEYDVTSRVSLIAEQEVTWGSERDTQDTRFGIRARPWTGASIDTSLGRHMTENGERLFATTGLIQQWQFNDRWRFDFGADRVQTFKESGAANDSNELLFNASQPPASGSVNDDFSAFYAGFGYRRDSWDVSSRLEFHQGDEADKWNFLAGASRQLADGKVMSGSLAVLLEDRETGARRDQTELRWGVAWRPSGHAWMFLNRLDLVFDKLDDLVFDTRTRKLVNNFNANYKPNDAQLSLQLGFKYVVEDIDGDEYAGNTGLVGAEFRYDLGPKWDVGVRGAMLISMESNLYRYSTGISVGYNVMQNMWVSLGYNFLGFEDDDFVGADYTAKGPFLKLRMKFDRDLLRKFLSFAGVRSSLAEPVTGAR